MSNIHHEPFRIRAITERVKTKATAKVIAERLTAEYGRPITRNAICGILFRARKSGKLAEVARSLAAAAMLVSRAPAEKPAKIERSTKKPPAPARLADHPKPPPPPPSDAVPKPVAAPKSRAEYEAFRAKVLEAQRQTCAASTALAAQFGVTRGVIRGILLRSKAVGELPTPEPQPEPQPATVHETIGHEDLRARVLEAHQKPGASRTDTAKRFGTTKAVVDGILRQRAKAAKAPPREQKPEPPALALGSRSDEDRAALRLKAEGLSCSAIARRIGLKPKAAESRLSRLADRGITTVAQYELAEARGEIAHTAGARVKTELNEAVLQRRAEGKTGAEIGRALGLSKKVVEGVVSRARKAGDPRAEVAQPPVVAPVKKPAPPPQQPPKRPFVFRMIGPFEEGAKEKKEAAARAQAHAARLQQADAEAVEQGKAPLSEEDMQRMIEEHIRQKGVTKCAPGAKSYQSECIGPSPTSKWRAGGL